MKWLIFFLSFPQKKPSGNNDIWWLLWYNLCTFFESLSLFNIHNGSHKFCSKRGFCQLYNRIATPKNSKKYQNNIIYNRLLMNSRLLFKKINLKFPPPGGRKWNWIDFFLLLWLLFWGPDGNCLGFCSLFPW